MSLAASPGRIAGQARVEVKRVCGQSAITSVQATNPVKILAPRSRGMSVWVYASNFGGGMVAGDQTSLSLNLGQGTRCFVSTQASTKIYRNPGQKPCGHRMSAVVAEKSLLVMAPDPVQCFAGSGYRQDQEFRLHPDSGLILIDWCCSGRAARGERWAFSRYSSRNEVFIGERRAVLDSLILDPVDGPLDGPHRLGRFNCLAMMLLVGESLREPAEAIVSEIDRATVPRRGNLIMTASRIRDGMILRAAGESVEMVGRELRHRLGFVTALLGDDPWARKW